MSDANRKPLGNAAESETLRMCGNSMHGNRETLETPAPQGAGRSEKASCRTSDTHVARESDGLIVPKKRANKAGPKAAAEPVEGRGPTKGNDMQVLLAADTAPRKAWHRHAWRTSGRYPRRYRSRAPASLRVRIRTIDTAGLVRAIALTHLLDRSLVGYS